MVSLAWVGGRRLNSVYKEMTVRASEFARTLYLSTADLSPCGSSASRPHLETESLPVWVVSVANANRNGEMRQTSGML